MRVKDFTFEKIDFEKLIISLCVSLSLNDFVSYVDESGVIMGIEREREIFKLIYEPRNIYFREKQFAQKLTTMLRLIAHLVEWKALNVRYEWKCLEFLQ